MPDARLETDLLPALDCEPLLSGWDEFAPRPRRLPTTRIARAQGLKSAQAHTAVIGLDERVWISGPCGLACYDGTRVSCFDQSHGLSLQGLRGLGVDAEGRIWVGTDGGIDRVETDGTIKQIAHGAAWPFGPSKRIEATPDGSIYVGTDEGLIAQTQGGFFAPVDHPILRNDVILDTAVDASGRLLVAGARSGISILAGNVWRTISPTVYEAVGLVTRIAANTASGHILIGGANGLVSVSPESDLANRACPLIATGIVSAIRGGGGVLWAASASRLSLLRERKNDWSTVASSDIGATINDLTMDRYGNVWCATDSAGVNKISFMHAYFTQPQLDDAGQFFSVRPGRDGTLLIGTEHALLRAKPGVVDEFSRIEPLVDGRVWDAQEDPDGTLWIATHRFGLLKRDASGVLERVGESDRVLRAPCRSLARLDDALWVGTLGGLTSIRGDAITELRDADNRTLGYVYTLLANETDMWIGTLGNGLWHYTAATGLRRIENDVLLRNGNIYAIARNVHGEMAVLQDRQLVRLMPEGATVIATATRPIIGWTMAFPSTNRLAVGSSDGIIEYDFANGEELRQIRCGGLGVEGWEFTSSRALLIDYRGRFWCALNASLTLVEPDDLTIKVSPPVVHLHGLQWEKAEVKQEAKRFVVEAGKWRATIRYFSAWLVDETDVQFRHKLIGFEEEWSPLHREAEYAMNSLPPGTYLFECQAYSPLCGYGPISELVAIDVISPWWTRGALGTIGASLSSVRGLFTGQARNQRLLEANQALSEAVARRTAEVTNANLALHEANERLANLLRVDVLTEIPNRRRFDEVIADEWKRAVRDKFPLSVLAVDIDHFKAFNDRYGHPRGDACLRLVAQCLARTVREGIDTCARYGGEEFMIVLPHTSARNAQMLAERLCAAVDHLNIENTDSPVAPVVTVSVGVNTLEPNSRDSVAQLVTGADKSLYAAKHAGRNQVGPIGGE